MIGGPRRSAPAAALWAAALLTGCDRFIVAHGSVPARELSRVEVHAGGWPLVWTQSVADEVSWSVTSTAPSASTSEPRSEIDSEGVLCLEFVNPSGLFRVGQTSVEGPSDLALDLHVSGAATVADHDGPLHIDAGRLTLWRVGGETGAAAGLGGLQARLGDTATGPVRLRTEGDADVELPFGLPYHLKITAPLDRDIDVIPPTPGITAELPGSYELIAGDGSVLVEITSAGGPVTVRPW